MLIVTGVEFQASLGYIARLYLQHTKKNGYKRCLSMQTMALREKK
jgi:hypothetical protein